LLGSEECSSQKGRGFKFQFIIIIYYILFFNSLYLLVYGDDRVTCYMGVDDVSGGASDA